MPDPERRLAIRRAGQEVANQRYIVVSDPGEHQSLVAVQLFHDGGDLEIRVDPAGADAQAAVLRHTPERGAKP